MWGQPPSAVRRSEALLAVQRSCPPLKKLDGGRASPPVQVRALACFQIPLPPPRTTWGQPPPAVRRSAAPLAVRTLLPAISKKTSVEDGRPRPSRFEHSRASQIPSRHHEPRRGGRIWKKNRVRAAFSYPPTNRRSRFQKHGKSGVTTPTTNLLKMVFWSCAYVPLAGIRM